MEKDIQKRIDETLETNYVKRVSTKPFFYTRVQAKMEAQPAGPLISLIPVSLRVACSTVLIINAIFFLSTLLANKTESASDQLASFYHFNSSVYSNF